MKKKALINILFLFLMIAMAASGCSSNNGDIISKTGTMKYINFNGLFYGIVSDDGQEYEVANLDPTFEEDGLRVHFDAKILNKADSIHTWGTVVELIDIEKIQGG